MQEFKEELIEKEKDGEEDSSMTGNK